MEGHLLGVLSLFICFSFGPDKNDSYEGLISFNMESGNNYTISGLDTTATVTVEFDPNIGVDEPFAPNVNLYPNPFSNQISIMGAEHSTLKIMDVAGVLVHIQKITQSSEQIQLGNLLSGAYFFHLERNKESKIIKVMKQ